MFVQFGFSLLFLCAHLQYQFQTLDIQQKQQDQQKKKIANFADDNLVYLHLVFICI